MIPAVPARLTKLYISIFDIDVEFWFRHLPPINGREDRSARDAWLGATFRG